MVCPGTALPHADTSEGVIKEAASLVRLAEPVEFQNEANDLNSVCDRHQCPER